MRAFVITGPGTGSVQDVDPPVAGDGQAVIEIERAGVCGTDEELFSGKMAYLETGDARYPLRIGHEWCGRVAAVGAGVDQKWIGRRVTGDTMLGDQTCELCRKGKQYLCPNRYEVGIRHGWPGAIAEQLLMPVWALYEIPDGVDSTRGALVEPGGNAWRAATAAEPAAGVRVLVLGTGTIGLLAAMIARSFDAEVHILGHRQPPIDFARSLGFTSVWTADSLPRIPFDAVIDATNAPGMPARAIDLVEPGGRVVLIGIAGTPADVDARDVVLRDLTVRGLLSASPGLAPAIQAIASGRIDPSPIVAAVVGLDEVADVLAGHREPAWGAAPKIHVDPRLGGA
jgi:threonine dehydrogenase-like Zn-dependent dehydrogenase